MQTVTYMNNSTGMRDSTQLVSAATAEQNSNRRVSIFGNFWRKPKSKTNHNEDQSSFEDLDDSGDEIKTDHNKTEVCVKLLPSTDIIKIDTHAVDPRTFADYMTVCSVIARLPGSMVYDTVANIFAGSHRRPFRDTLLDSVMGHCYRSSTLTQLRILCGRVPLSRELSNGLYWFGGVHSLPGYNSEFEAPGFVARWVLHQPDRTPDDPVLLYFHGGGYALKTCQPQVEYIIALSKLFRRKKHRVSVLILDYSIAPFAQFPTQRDQAVACISALQNSCSNIILLGDSCGGNLALSALYEEDKLNYNNIMGCVLVSPWTDPGAQDGSMNSKRDILSKQRLNDMIEQFIPDPGLLKDPRVSPIRADPAMWERVLPKNTCCVWGAFECLADQAAEFQKVAKIENCFIEHNGTHDCILRGLKPKPSQYITSKLLSWISELEQKHGKSVLQKPK